MNGTQRKFTVTVAITRGESGSVADLVAARTGLSKGVVKDAMNKGALWIRKKKGGLRRLRKATAHGVPGNTLEFFYDERVLSVKPPEAVCLSDQTHYSVWFKPPGLMAQGTMYGDHCSLLRQAELYFKPSRDVFLVHRIDREASGIMLIAHTKDAAGKLSVLFQKNLIVKRYSATVLGDVSERGMAGTIDLPLDGKAAHTEYQAVSYDPQSNTSRVNVIITTGRLHQIRRHFDMIGHPVMGDPKYGKRNKNVEGMKLTAVSLKFHCPFRDEEIEFNLPE